MKFNGSFFFLILGVVAFPLFGYHLGKKIKNLFLNKEFLEVLM